MAPQPMEAHGPGGREGSWQTGGAVKYSVARWSPLLDALSKDGGLPTGTGAGCDVGGEVGHATEAHHGQSCVGDWTHLKNPWAALSFIALAANKASQMQGYAAAEVCYLASLFAVAHESTSFGAFAAAVRGALTEGGGWEGWSSSAMAQGGCHAGPYIYICTKRLQVGAMQGLGCQRKCCIRCTLAMECCPKDLVATRLFRCAWH